METSSSLPPAPAPALPAIGAGTTAAPDYPPYEAGVPVTDVVLSLSPEALAVLEGQLEPTAAVAAAQDRLGDDTLVRLGRAASPTGSEEDAPFELYGLVDIDGDGDLDGPAGAADPDGEDATGVNGADGDEAPGESAPGDDPDALSEDERRQVSEMAARDMEVRAHEFAHVAAGGGLTGAIRFSYQTGPDGKRYAVGGSVSIDTSPGRTPEETLTKAQKIRAAAMAPADPSPQDRAVASQANQMEARARTQLAQEQQEETQEAMEGAASGQSDAAAPVELSGEASEVATSQSIDAEGAEFTPAPTPSMPTIDDINDGPQVVDASAASAADYGGASRATLASFESGEARQAQLYSLPAPDNALVAGPVDPRDLPFTLVR